MNSSILEVLNKGRDYLKSKEMYHDEASSSSEHLLAHILRKPKSSLYLESSEVISGQKAKQFFDLLKLRAKRYPVQYLTKEAGFRFLALEVRPGTLIPRPETEILVDVVLKRLAFDRPMILDIGTGSGNIAISLAKEIREAKVVATDLSASSIKLAKKNAEQNGVLKRISFVKTNLWKGIRKKFDVVVSNPPYLSDKDFKKLQPEVRYEPKLALSGGPDGLKMYRTITRSVKSILKPDALIAFEVGINQADTVAELLESNKFYNIEVNKDLAGIDRIVSAYSKA